MADDEILEPDDIVEIDETAEDGADVDDLDVDDLDAEALEEDLEDDFESLDDDDDDTFTALDEDDEDDDETRSGPTRRSVSADDEDEDEDLLAPDDVEADLDTILKDRLVAAEEEGNEDDEEPEDRTESADRLQPKRADEVMCTRCFLLVRTGAPTCPVGDEDCPTVLAR